MTGGCPLWEKAGSLLCMWRYVLLRVNYDQHMKHQELSSAFRVLGIELFSFQDGFCTKILKDYFVVVYRIV